MFRSLLFLAALALVSCSGVSPNSTANPSPNLAKASFSAPKLPPPGGSPNIFKTYSTTENATMARGWIQNFDMSGVSFDQRQTATLVTRRHVVMANHYQRKIGAKVIFHDRNGMRVERTIVRIDHVLSDVAVGLLNLDVPPSLNIYPLPAPKEDYKNLVGKTAMVTDQNRRLFFHQITSVHPGRMAFRHYKPNLHGWGKTVVGGDSGNPSFIISGRELVLVETHTTGGGGAGPFYGNPKLQEQLQAKITAQAPGYKIRTKTL